MVIVCNVMHCKQIKYFNRYRSAYPINLILHNCGKIREDDKWIRQTDNVLAYQFNESYFYELWLKKSILLPKLDRVNWLLHQRLCCQA